MAEPNREPAAESGLDPDHAIVEEGQEGVERDQHHRERDRRGAVGEKTGEAWNLRARPSVIRRRQAGHLARSMQRFSTGLPR